jgi:hypothetical protein
MVTVNEPATGDLAVLDFPLEAGRLSTLLGRGDERRAGSAEGVENPATGWNGPHELPHQRGRLPGQVMLVLAVDRHLVAAWERPGMSRRAARPMSAPDDVFALMPHVALVGGA